MVGSFCEAVLTSLFSAQSSITFPMHFQWSFKTNGNAGSKHDLHKWDSAGAGSVYKNDPKLRTWWLSVNDLLYALKLIGCVWQRVLSPGGCVWIEKEVNTVAESLKCYPSTAVSCRNKRVPFASAHISVASGTGRTNIITVRNQFTSTVLFPTFWNDLEAPRGFLFKMESLPLNKKK